MSLWLPITLCTGPSRMPNTGWETANPITVATAHAISEMIRTRRSSSRCSMTVIRRSSSAGTMLGLAMAAPTGAGPESGLAVGRRLHVSGRFDVRGRPARGVLFGARIRRRALLELFLDVARGLAEFAHGLPDRPADFRELPRSVDDQHDDQDQNEDVPMTEKTRHSDCFSRPIIRPLCNGLLRGR